VGEVSRPFCCGIRSSTKLEIGWKMPCWAEQIPGGAKHGAGGPASGEESVAEHVFRVLIALGLYRGHKMEKTDESVPKEISAWGLRPFVSRLLKEDASDRRCRKEMPTGRLS